MLQVAASKMHDSNLLQSASAVQFEERSISINRREVMGILDGWLLGMADG